LYAASPSPAAVALLLVVRGLPHAQSKRLITETDLFKFVWIGDPQVPTVRRSRFVRVRVNEKENQYETSLALVPLDGSTPPRKLTSGIRDTASPRWSPDEKYLAFTSSTGREGQDEKHKSDVK
jgi:dipeptidyl aminopeptidase/acylaminoacyl peptidase